MFSISLIKIINESGIAKNNSLKHLRISREGRLVYYVYHSRICSLKIVYKGLSIFFANKNDRLTAILCPPFYTV